jgi:hypothetical protein
VVRKAPCGFGKVSAGSAELTAVTYRDVQWSPQGGLVSQLATIWQTVVDCGFTDCPATILVPEATDVFLVPDLAVR